MEYISLYRKYRPQTFDEVVGQRVWVSILRNSIARGKVSHAYIFSGPRGIGKTSLARIFAKALNCEKGPTPSPCNKCKNCIAITSGTSLDVVEIDGASNRGIDEIRALKDSINLKPAQSRYKVYIIDEVHMLTQEAFSALLKTLEEPPPAVVFIMATTDLFKVPSTIRSRAMVFNFSKIYPVEMFPRLRFVAEEENISISDSDLMRIARDADGSMRDALVILEQLATYSDGDIKPEDVDRLVSTLSVSSVLPLLEHLRAGDWAFGLKFIDGFLRKGGSPYSFIKGLRFAFWYLLISRHVVEADGLLSVMEEESKMMREFKSAWEEGALWSAVGLLDENYDRLYRGDDPSVVLGVVWASLVKLLAVSEYGPGEVVIRSVEKEEKTGETEQLELKKLMNALLERNVALYAFLGVAKSAELSNGVLDVVFEERYRFAYESLAESENRLEVETVLSELFSSEISLNVSIEGSEEPYEQEMKTGNVIREVISIFGGELLAFRNLQEGEEDE